MFANRKCLWCNKLFGVAEASCGTGTTWNLFKCPHCDGLTATGNIIPTEVRNDPEIRIEEEKRCLGNRAGTNDVFFAGKNRGLGHKAGTGTLEKGRKK